MEREKLLCLSSTRFREYDKTWMQQRQTDMDKSESRLADEGFADKGLQDLVEKVVHGFVASLQKDSTEIWQSFNEVLAIIQPYASLIEENAQLMHYVERTYYHFCENPNCGLDVNSLSLAFPREMHKMQQNDKTMDSRKVKFPSRSPEPSEIYLPVKKMGKRKQVHVSVPKGTVIPSSDIYDGHIEQISDFFPEKELHLDDLRKSLPFVVYEIGLREASWGRPLGITATALNIDLADMVLKPTSPRGSCFNKDSCTSPSSLKSPLDNKIAKEEKAERKVMTGREVVEKFVKGSFLGVTKFAYLNVAPSKHYEPYNLVVVPRNKMEPEHYVVSSHAILHVIPNGPSELLPLDEWYKEALLFSAILKFNFFKNFLLAKMFLKWKHVKKMSQFRALCQYVGKVMVLSTPSYGSALIRISSLIQDLDQVQFLPLNDLKCKKLQEFSDVTVKLLDDAQECLKMFFTYCLSVINKTRENSFEYLEYCKEQVKRKPQNPKGSLSLARERKAIKEQNMKLAHLEIYQMEKFVKLVEQILLTKLLTLARYNVCTFVNNVLGSQEIKEKGLFSVLLQFDKMDKLVLVPSREKLQGSLFFFIERILTIICQSSESFDVGLCEKAGHMEDSPCASSERNDSQNRLQNFLGQSPVLSAPSTSLPALSVKGEDGLNWEAGRKEDLTAIDGKAETVGAANDDKMEKLKNLLAESLQETVELCQHIEEEEHPETPKACVSLSGVLLVKGKEIQPQKGLTSPLSKTKLEGTVLNDEEILAAMRKKDKIVNSALEEVDVFCREHEWIVEINKFVRTWDATVLASWRGKSPEKIEKQLGQIKTWIEQLSNVAQSFVTSNGLLFVDCSSIHGDVIPQLNAIFRQLTKMVAKDLLRMSANFSVEVTELTEKLSNKHRGLKAFAEFILIQRETKEKVPSLQVKVEYIKSLFDMVRSGHRQLTRIEEEAEEKTWSSWEKFLLSLQESSDFLLVETPKVLGDLEETILTLEYQARIIGEKAISGEFLIPENDPTMILSHLRQLRGQFSSLLSKLDDLVQCREVICKRKYNKDDLLAILNKMDVRYELWKYYDVSAHTINDWLQMAFRKMNVKKVTEKISEWQFAAQNLKSSLFGGDEVYESWIKQMESFMKEFPLLQQLSSDALKQRHWQALFVGMGQQYDVNWQFTIADLFSFKLGLYKDLINSVCNGALHEYALEIQLRSLAKVWTEKDFKLAKHFARTRSSLDSETDSLSGKSPSRQGARSRQNNPKLKDVYILTGDDELKFLIEDNRVTLQLMLVSPYVADFKPTVEAWMKKLEQLEEILELWVACQKKWLYLSLVFTENSGQYKKAAVNTFEQVDSRFKDFIQNVVKDSKVLSILAKKRGEKGYRELQGEALRSMLFSLLKQQEELLKSVEENMEKIREAFPRLYFLSDSEVLDAMVISRDPRKLMPVVRKCFPGIKSVRFGLPDDSTMKLSTALDAALNAHLLQVTAVEGDFGEVMFLTDPIAPCMDSQTWLKVLEKSVKTALIMNITECMVSWSSRRNHKTTAVSDVLDKDEYKEDISTDKSEASSTIPECQQSETPWLLKYPSQCLRSVESAVWFNDISHALHSKDKNELKAISSFANRRVEDYATVLGGRKHTWLTNILRSRPTLESLLVCAIHKRDVVERLLSCKEVCLHCFEWQSCLKHYISLKKVFSTSYCSGLPGTSTRVSLEDQIPLDMKYETEEYSISLLDSEFQYGFEYLSEPVSLVVTPLTERCFLTLSMALKHYSCGAPFGGCGTGKTETIKELAKIMGRHLVFFNCSYSMANGVATRLLTGMILNGSLVCFENAHNLPQRMLSTVGEYLGCIRESYKCLVINKSNQYCVRGMSKADGVQNAEVSHVHRRNSLITLDPLTVPATTCGNLASVAFPSKIKKSTSVTRRHSIACDRNINKTQFYENEQPLPISIPLTPEASLTDCALFSRQDKNMEIAYQQPNDFSLGNIVFNGMLLKAHPMAGSFMTITPTTDGHLNLPENLKVSLRTVAMMEPDMKRILEAWLLCNGFSDVGALVQKISFFIKVIREQFPSECDIQTNGLKTAIRIAGNKLRLEQSISHTTKPDVAASTEELEFKSSKEDVEECVSATSFLDEFESRTTQESALVFGLFSVLCPKLDENRKRAVCDIIDTVFTHTVLTSATQTNTDRVAEVVRQQLNAESLQSNMDLVSKIIQLYQVLQTNHAVIIMGSSGTGKTTIYQTLCRAINSLNTQVARDSSEDGHTKTTSKTEQRFPKVNLSVLFPRAMNENELFGWIDPVTKLWVDGILVKRARNALAVKTASDNLSSRMKRDKERLTSTGPTIPPESDFHQWVVLDGPLDRGCVDQMNSLFDSSRTLSLTSGEMVPLSETLSFVLELDNLKDAAPAVVSRCGIVYCPDDIVGWKSIFKSWLKGAHIKWNISIRGLGIVSSLMEHCVEKTLTFLSHQGASILYANYYDNQRWKMGARGVHEIQRFLSIYSSLFDKHILRDNDETFNILDHLKDERYSASCSSSETASGRSSCIPASDTNTVISSFAYAFIWAFGGDLHESCIEMFDEFVKSLLSTGPHPHRSLPPVSVFDYHLDFPAGSLLSSTEKLSGATRTIASSYVVVPRAEIYFALLDLLVSASKPVLLVGPPGSGKTSFMQNLINPRYKYTRVSLAHGMTTQLLQETIEAKVQLTKRRRSVVNNPTLLAQASRNLFFLDDLNLASNGTTSNIQPSTEFLRSLLSLGGLYDRQRLCLKPLSQTSIVCAAVPAGCPRTGGGVTSFPISPRLARIMVVLSFHSGSGATLRSIYRNLFQTWLEDFPAYSLTHHHQLAKAISTSTVCLFETISQELRPTPVNPHYVFTHHDVARVFQGMMLFSSRTKKRSRPKVRHKRRMVTEMVQITPEMPFLPLNNCESLSYQDVVGSNIGEKENNLHEDKSWPMVTRKETLVSMNSKTPAVLAPMIRVLLRLWCHECSRVFSDRLIGEDKLWFSSTLQKTAIQQFCETSLAADDKGGVDRIITIENTDPLTSSLEKDDENMITSKDEESGEGENFVVDDVETEVDHETTVEEDNSNNEKTGDEIVREHREVDDACGDPEDVAQSGEEKPDSRMTDDNSVDEIRFKYEELSMPRTTPGKQRVVTFEDMSKEQVYRGPLISPNQLMEQGEDLSKILFCRHFMSTTQECGSDLDKGYNEYSVDALVEGLNRCQQLYNSQETQCLDLVFFEQAVRHAARLSRCLSLSSGHTIFFSQSGHGRKSIVSLASFSANCKLIKLKSNRREDSRQRMKSAIYLAGLQGKPVVLYVPEDMDQETMLDVCSLMNEGNSPGLYSPNDLATICGELIPGGQRGRRNENLVIAQERFFRRVRSNLHVVLSLEHPSNKMLNLSKCSLYSFFLTRASGIDVYQPWHHNALAKVSLMRLKDIDMDSVLQDIVNPHLTSVTSVMSYIHRSSLETIAKQFGFSRYKCYSPATFIEFVNMFGKCCKRIWREEQGKIERCKQALKKVDEANGQINEMQKDLDSFVPILRNAEKEVKNCLELVESLQSEYTKGREDCKQQEGEIEKMMAPIEELERLAKIELDRVSPVFKSAYDALRALNVYDVEEIRSYRTPPDQVVLVVNAVCLLFGKEECWEEGKVLFTHEDFIKDLEFFDMKAISDKTFRRLKEYVDNPKFVPDAVREGSLAAMSVCVWIRAVYHFCVVYREYFPKQQRVIEAKKILEEAVAYLGDLRVRCNEIKTEVEAKIEEYKEKVHHARSIEKQIQITEQRKSRAISLIKSMSVHVNSWEEALRDCQYHIKTLAGDALLAAAYVCYLGPMDQETKAKLLCDWNVSCQGSTRDDKSDEDDNSEEDEDTDFINDFQPRSSCRKIFTNIPRPCIKRVPVRNDFSLRSVFTTEEELYNWRYSGLPSNSTAIENALLMRSICELGSSHWPLLIDTDMQSYMWVKCLHQTVGDKDQEHLDYLEMNLALENPLNDEDVSLPVSPCLTNADEDSTEDRSTNYEESDSTTLNSNQSSRRASAAAAACSGPLIREELARELNIQTSPLDYTSTDSASTDIDFNDERIMIISAADRQKDVKICGAISVGATVMLVDVERKKLGTRLDNLLARNTFTDNNGKRKIRIGSRCIDYHPSFRLYLYTNMPLELTMSAISLPFKKCLVINMALSCEGLQELLLSDVLSLERPEYENQRRSLEADIFHHKQQIKIAENSILDQVINLQERLLENGAIHGCLKECDELCDTATQQLEESKALYELAKEKLEDYSHVSEHGAALLVNVSKLSRLHSYYQMPFQPSLGLFHEVIMQRRRGTRLTGSSLARSAELITYITRSMCSRVARSVFSDHYDVFTFLVAVEKLRLAGQLSEDEWELFCRVTPETSPEKCTIDTSSDDSSPSWISSEIWTGIIELDILPGCHGLKESIQSNSGLWKEYFELPPTLMAPTPSNFHQLSVFQRALLWKTFKKDKLHNIAKDLVLYQLGTSASTVTSFSINDAYQDSTCITPVIIFTPEAQKKEHRRKQNLKDPVSEIVALAKRHEMNDKLRFLALGGKLQTTEVSSVLRRACEHGLWLVIQNCHLIAEWLPELLDIFHQITLSGSKEQIMSKHGIFELDSNPYMVTSCAFSDTLVMHPKFRLWLITSPESATPLPAVLIRYGIKLAWDDKLTFETSVRHSFLTMWNKTKRSNKLFKELKIKDVQAEPLLPYLHSLALFHCVLHHRCQYRSSSLNIPYHWLYSDLSWGLKAVHALISSVLCSCLATTCQSSALRQIISILYGGQVLDLLDWTSIVALSEKHLIVPNLTTQTTNDVAEQSTDILFSRLPLAVNLNNIGLNESLSIKHDIHVSNELAVNISKAFGTLQGSSLCFKPISYFQEILDAFVEIKSVVHLEQSNSQDGKHKSSLSAFLDFQKLGYLTLLNTMTSQLQGIIKSLRGDISFTSDIRELAMILCNEKIPSSWRRKSKACPSLAVWIDYLKRHVRAVVEYSQRPSDMPPIFNIAAFLNKQTFFFALMVDWSKASGRPVHMMDISIEVCQSSCTEQLTAVHGVYLTGVVLCNASWNETDGCLEEQKEGQNAMPCLLLRPRERINRRQVVSDKEDRLLYQHNCPVYFYDDFSCKSRANAPFSHVPLRSRLPHQICEERQVFLTCSM